MAQGEERQERHEREPCRRRYGNPSCVSHFRYVTNPYRHGAPPCVHQAGPAALRPSSTVREAAPVFRSFALLSPVRPAPARHFGAAGLAASLRPLLLHRRIVSLPGRHSRLRKAKRWVQLPPPSRGKERAIRILLGKGTLKLTRTLKGMARCSRLRSRASFPLSFDPHPCLGRPRLRATDSLDFVAAPAAPHPVKARDFRPTSVLPSC